MSTIAVNAITDANGGATTTINSVTPNANNVIGKNLIINGAMQIAQRGTSTTGVTGSNYYTCDRYKTILTGLGTWTVEQSTDAPDGFSNSLKHSCTTADASPAAADILYLSQIIESQNLQQVAKGTASAKSLTCSFWVKSNKTGTYIVGLQEFQNTRYIANSYTINAANTWEKKTITFAGDTTGTLANDNSAGLYLQFYLGSGSDYSSGTLATSWESTVNVNRAVGQVNLADSTSNYINITGVQLEVGDAATEFEHRPYGMELQLCQRYYQDFANNMGVSLMAFKYTPNNGHWLTLVFNPRLRASPTVTSSSWAAVQPSVYAGNSVGVTFNHPTTSFHCQASTVVNASAEL